MGNAWLFISQEKKLNLKSSYVLKDRLLAIHIHAHNHGAKFTQLVINYKSNSINGKSARTKEGQGNGHYLSWPHSRRIVHWLIHEFLWIALMFANSCYIPPSDHTQDLPILNHTAKVCYPRFYSSGGYTQSIVWQLKQWIWQED